MAYAQLKLEVTLNEDTVFEVENGKLILVQTIEVEDGEYDEMYGDPDSQGDFQTDAITEIGNWDFTLLDDDMTSADDLD